MKQAIADSVKEVVYGSVRMESKRPKTVWQSDTAKDAVQRKDSAWKEVLGVKNDTVKDE